MSRVLAAGLAASVGLTLVHCAGPQASGTKTNWFLECDRDADCDTELSCTCGLCSLPCSSDADCEEGLCATALEAEAQCAVADAESLCLPEDGQTCSEFAIADDPDLGQAIAPTCPIPGALICEGFDRAFPEEYSTWYEGDMTAVIEDCEVARGEGAIHYTSSAFGQSQTRIALPSAVTSGPVYARFFLRLAGDMVLPEQLQVLELWDREESAVPERIAVIVTAAGSFRVFVGASSTTLEPDLPSILPRDQWLCVELGVDVQDQDGSATLEVDGTQVLSRNGLLTQPTNPLSVVVVEAQPTVDAAGVDVHLDDLVVATAPIGCD